MKHRPLDIKKIDKLLSGENKKESRCIRKAKQPNEQKCNFDDEITTWRLQSTLKLYGFKS